MVKTTKRSAARSSKPSTSRRKPSVSASKPKVAVGASKSKRSAVRPKAGPAHGDGPAGVKAWISGVKPEHRSLVKRIDVLVANTIPGITRAIKWRKPSQPLGVPFYGLPGKGWLVAMWSFKDSVAVGLYAVGLEPSPPVAMVHARGIKYEREEDFDEGQLRSWLEQSRDLPGWGKGSAELAE